MRRILCVVPLMLLAAAGCAKKAASSAAATTARAPEATGIDETAIDASVKPCDDFYQYACGNWIKRTEIPADQSRWVRSFSVIDEQNQAEMRKLAEAAAHGENIDAYADKIGAYYASCVDEEKIEANAPRELKQLLGRIDAIRDQTALVHMIAYLHLGIAAPLFNFRSQQDFHDPTQVIGVLDQGGLGLPDRDYYLKTDGKFPELRKQYQAHVQRMLELAGQPRAAAAAQTVMKIETALATASMARVERRDPHKVYHRLELAGIQKTAPRFNWKMYLSEIGHPDAEQINVTVPDFFSALNAQLTKVSLADWKTYLRWHTVHGVAETLSKPFVDETFAFYGKALNGTAELEPRWKRCVRATDRALGEALGRAFVQRTFGQEGKTTTQSMVRAVEAAMNVNLDGLAWMDPATRTQAQDKLSNIANKIGFPDKWRNYDALELSRDSYLLNAIQAAAFEVHRNLSKIGKPLDRTEWGMTPPTVNAYYNGSLNEMVFPAGILQPPFFNRQATTAVNFGAIGMVMGHELTHGFDDRGRQFDAKGSLRDWWTAPVNAEFERRAACVVEQYNGYVAVDDMHVNGKLTLGENIADLGGMKLAHAAYIKSRPGPARVTTAAGALSDEQLFYLGFAQGWCSKQRPENARLRVVTDSHSPSQFRVNGPLSNLPEFAAAFQCKAGDAMVRQNRCVVW